MLKTIKAKELKPGDIVRRGVQVPFYREVTDTKVTRVCSFITMRQDDGYCYRFMFNPDDEVTIWSLTDEP